MKRFTTHEFSFDVLPALSLRLPLTRKGRGFLQPDGHVRPRECSAQRCDRDRALIRNRRTSTLLFQALRHLSAPCGNHSITRLKILPFITTLATSLGAHGLALLLGKNDAVSISSDTNFANFGQGDLFGLPISGLIALV